MSPKKIAAPLDVYVRVSDVRGRSGDSFISPKDQEERSQRASKKRHLRCAAPVSNGLIRRVPVSRRWVTQANWSPIGSAVTDTREDTGALSAARRRLWRRGTVPAWRRGAHPALAGN